MKMVLTFLLLVVQTLGLGCLSIWAEFLGMRWLAIILVIICAFSLSSITFAEKVEKKGVKK